MKFKTKKVNNSKRESQLSHNRYCLRGEELFIQHTCLPLNPKNLQNLVVKIKKNYRLLFRGCLAVWQCGNGSWALVTSFAPTDEKFTKTLRQKMLWRHLVDVMSSLGPWGRGQEWSLEKQLQQDLDCFRVRIVLVLDVAFNQLLKCNRSEGYKQHLCLFFFPKGFTRS